MMTLRSFDDVAKELRRINDELDKLRIYNYDMNGRRVTNAGRAQSLSDLTTKQDVLDLLRSDTPQNKIDPGWLQIDFTVSAPAIGDDIAPRPVPFLPYELKGVPVLCGARVRTAPSGGPLTLRWNHYSKYNDNTVDLFNGQLLTIPDGGSYATITKFFPNRNISTQDYFTLDIEEVNESAGLYTFLAVMVN